MFKSLKELLDAPGAPDPDSRRARRARRSLSERGAPLPEVSEVDWSEWENSVLHSELDSLLSGPAPLPAPIKPKDKPDRPTASALPEVHEVDWSVWEESMRGELEPRPAGRKQRRE
jgi:hypothetical protein